MKMKSMILGVACAIACMAVPSLSQVAGTDARVSLRVEDRALSEIVQYLRDQSGANIVVVDGADTQIDLDITDVPWQDALDIVAEVAGCVVENRTAGVLAITRPPRVDFEFRDSDIREVIETISKLSGANVVVAPEIAGTLSLRLTNVPWRDALDVAVKTLGFVVVEEERGILRVVDPLTLQAQLEAKSYQLRFIRPPGNYVPILESEFVARTTQIKAAGGGGAGGGAGGAAAQAEKKFPVIQALRKALSPAGDLDYIPTQNVVIVRDTAQVHAAIQDMLDRLDVEPAQVFVDVKFISTANNDVFSLGVDYGDRGPSASFSLGQIPITLPFDLGSGGWDDLIIASPSGDGPFADGSLNGGSTVIPDTIFGSLSFTGVAGMLRLLQSDGSSEVVQAPKIIAIDGYEATIFVGETIRYAEAKTEQGQSGGLQLSVAEASGSPVDVGFQLLIVPHVIPGTNKLEMEIIPKETSLTGQGDPSIAPAGFDVYTVGASGLEGTIALPRKRTSTIVTSMMLESGQTVMIGGLATDNQIESETRVPYLSRIPLLGWLFKHEEKSVQKTSLLVFITPTVVRGSVDTQRLLERELNTRRAEYGKRIEDLIGSSLEDSRTSLQAPVPAPDAAAEAELSFATFVQEPETATGPGQVE